MKFKTYTCPHLCTQLCLDLDSRRLQTLADTTRPPPRQCSVLQKAAKPGRMKRCYKMKTNQPRFSSSRAQVSSTTHPPGGGKPLWVTPLLPGCPQRSRNPPPHPVSRAGSHHTRYPSDKLGSDKEISPLPSSSTLPKVNRSRTGNNPAEQGLRPTQATTAARRQRDRTLLRRAEARLLA